MEARFFNNITQGMVKAVPNLLASPVYAFAGFLAIAWLRRPRFRMEVLPVIMMLGFTPALYSLIFVQPRYLQPMLPALNVLTGAGFMIALSAVVNVRFKIPVQALVRASLRVFGPDRASHFQGKAGCLIGLVGTGLLLRRRRFRFDPMILSGASRRRDLDLSSGAAVWGGLASGWLPAAVGSVLAGASWRDAVGDFSVFCRDLRLVVDREASWGLEPFALPAVCCRKSPSICDGYGNPYQNGKLT